jgi:hypothetical protein
MTDEQIFELANREFEWIDDEGDIMEGTLNSDDILKFAQKIAKIAYDNGWNDGHESGSTGIWGEPLW